AGDLVVLSFVFAVIFGIPLLFYKKVEDIEKEKDGSFSELRDILMLLKTRIKSLDTKFERLNKILSGLDPNKKYDLETKEVTGGGSN
ncbi:MAG: hypothetical protein ACOCUD_05140, partial [Bacillota bacterium]